MNHKLLAAGLGALALAGPAAPLALAAQPVSNEAETAAPVQTEAEEEAARRREAERARIQAEADARWQRLQAETEAALAARRAAEEEYERGMREAEAARIQYEADMARHREELERGRLEQERYRREMEEYEAMIASGRYRSTPSRDEREARPAGTGGAAGAAGETREVREVGDRGERRERRSAVADDESCERQLERNRRRGRAVGGLIGGVAALLTGRAGDADKDGLSFIPAAEMLGEAVAGLLDCDEQRQAAAATEQAAEGGVGTTASWTSATRPGVSGSSTVTALEAEAGGGQCITVTDIIIVDGEETRAPKRLCRRPPSTRYVRV